MQSEVTLRRTIPWGTRELVRLGDLGLYYSSPDHRHITEAVFYLPGGVEVNFSELTKLARKLGLEVRLPSFIRTTNLNY